jgi:cell division protein FtsQ
VAASKQRSAVRPVAVSLRGALARRELIPSLRSVAVGISILAAALGAYALARETSLFAVRTIEIKGGSPRVQAEVRKALAPELGRPLLAISGAGVSHRVASLPDVVSVRFDRAFPHTLKITVKPEHAVLLLRQGTKSWVVSARGRVMRRLSSPKRSRLPREWIPKKVEIKVGETLPRLDGTLAAAAVTPIIRGSYSGHVRTVSATASSLTLVMRRGTQIRIGDIGNLRLKLAIAARVLELAAKHEHTSGVYVDVSVPGRPVLGSLQPSGANSQVASTG